MNPLFFHIASTKTTNPAASKMLAHLEHTAQKLADAEASFPERINTNKAKRGETPTKLRKTKKQQLSGLEQDKTDLDTKLCDDFRKMVEPSQIIWCIQNALTQDLSVARKFLKYYHPDDLPLGEEILNLKSQLLDATTSFLKAYPNIED